jgi:dihydroxyacetone kinase-like predicted kinase
MVFLRSASDEVGRRTTARPRTIPSASGAWRETADVEMPPGSGRTGRPRDVGQPVTRLSVDGPTLIRAVQAATRNLERHVDEVDALNVFPVPDGDTGSNMLATMRAALAAAEALPQDRQDLHSVAEALSRGALTGARGNSGVILSQIIRGMTSGADGRQRADGAALAVGLRRGSEVAYDSVLTPVEGTILTVIRDAADAAEAAAGRQPHVETVLADVIEAAASSVQRTPTLLPVLEDAGVVDSGGQGLFRVLEGMLQVPAAQPRSAQPGQPRSVVAEAAAGPGAVGTSPGQVAGPPTLATPASAAVPTHGYETQYLLASATAGIDLAALRASIEAVGDSVIVAGDGSLARVHVHGERPDLAIAAGLRWGRLDEVEIIDLDGQVAHHLGTHDDASVLVGSGQHRPVRRDEADATTHGVASNAGSPRGDPPGRAVAAASGVASPPALAGAPIADAPASSGVVDARARSVPGVSGEARPSVAAMAVVAVSAADGLADVLASLGARVVRPGHGSCPSVGELADAILGTGAAQVLVLPNDRDAILAAGRAAELTPSVIVAVIPSRNTGEGIAAALAFDASASLEENVARMTAEAARVRSFRVVTAVRDSVVHGTPVKRGQVLALDPDRRVIAAGDVVEDVTLQALDHLSPFELVTLYCGVSELPGRSLALRARIELAGFGAEVEVVAGGLRHDHLLVTVE